jgi:alpha-beta hydrolase superfamily lysophospholipase
VTIFAGKLLSALLPRAGLIALEAEGVCRDPAVVEAYVNDPLVYTGKATARLGAELLKSMAHITAEAGKITLPVLIVQGGADRLVDPAGARMLYDAVGSADKTLRVYDGFYHEVFNEPEHEQVLGDVEEWLEKRL